MRIYSVHIRRDGLDPDRDIALVKEGFSWPAALFAPFWALCRGLWAVAAALILLFVGVAIIVSLLDLGDFTSFCLFAGPAAVVGFVANDLVRTALARRGFVMRDIVAATDRDSAAFRFFDRNPELANAVMGAEDAA